MSAAASGDGAARAERRFAPPAAWGAVLLLVCSLLFGLNAGPARAALSFPPLTGRVVDDAHILTPDVTADLTRRLADLEQRTSRQLVVVTLPSLQGTDISDYGYQLLRTWGIGQKGTNNGALFIIVPSERKVRVEVGYGLEPVLTDAVSSQILQEKVLPAFRSGDLRAGVVAGTQALIDQLGADPSTAEAKAAAALQAQAQDHAYGHARRPVSLFGLIIPLIFIFIVVSGIFRGGRGGGFLPGLMLGSLLGGFRGGGDDDGGGGGDDGFSGGGGSGGGGGASGSW